MNTELAVGPFRTVPPLARCGLAVLALLAAGGARGQGPVLPSHDALVGQAVSAARSLPKAEEDETIDTIIVTPDAFAETDRKLAKITGDLPGAENPLDLQLGILDHVENYFANRADPNALSDDSKKTILKSFEPASNNP